MKRVKYIVAMLVISVGVGIFFLMSTSNQQTEKFALTTIERGNLEILVSSTGTLSAVETVEIGAQVSADIEEIMVDFNDKVTKGQTLAIFDNTLFKADVQKAQAELNRVQVQLNQAQAEYNRNLPLFKKGFLSETEFLIVKSNLETSQAELKVAQANVASAEMNLKYTVIRSPITGTVIEKSVETGQSIVSRMTTPTLFIIAADLSKMQIMADVDESDIGKIEVGQSVRFTVQAYPDEIFYGTVRQVRLQPQTVQNVVNYTVVVDAENKNGHLLPGMTATLDFIIQQRKNILLVSNRAMVFQPSPELIKRDEGFKNKESGLQDIKHVFVETEDGLIKPVHFKAGISDGNVTEVIESPDLMEGMQIISGYELQKKQKKSSRFPFGGPPGRRGHR